MTETQRLLDDTVMRLFAAAVTPERLAAAETGVWLGTLWDAAEANGLTTVHLDERAGGAGATWHEAFVVARACGRYAVPLPVVETMLAAWLAARAGLPVPPGPLGLAPHPAMEAAKGTRMFARVPWGRRVGHVVAATPDAGGLRVTVFAAAGAEIAHGHSIAREPRDTLTLATAPLAGGHAPLAADTVAVHGAMLRAAQMAGALETVLDMAVQYANERVQFGRPIGQFQVIQQELARLAGLVATAGMAAETAARALACGTANPAIEVAAAKVVAGDAAEHGPRIAHQVHGAIGFTYEHRLHFFTRRLWAWRAEFGTPDDWATRLGDLALAAGADGLWPLVTRH